MLCGPYLRLEGARENVTPPDQKLQDNDNAPVAIKESFETMNIELEPESPLTDGKKWHRFASDSTSA